MTIQLLSPDRERAEAIILERLKESPASVEEIVTLLSERGIPFSRRLAEGIIWQMTYDGVTSLSDDLMVELVF